MFKIRNKMAKEKSAKAGLLGVGLNTYWNQFQGLWERLEEYQNEIGRRMDVPDVEVINVSIVDSQESDFRNSRQYSADRKRYSRGR